MRSFGWTAWLAATVGAAIVVGCVSEVPDSIVGGKSASDAARPLTDPDQASTGPNSPRGNANGNGNANDNGSSGCDRSCPDFDGDGAVGVQDLSLLLSSFSLPPAPPCTDIDGSGLVDLQDLAFLLGSFGSSCNVNGNGNANDNGSANSNDNGAGNTNDNGAGNTNDNGAGNTNDNGAGNTNDNGAGNTNDNGAGNTNDNGAGNTNDNGAGNTNDNGAGNTNDNGAGNTNDNGSGNTNDNGAGNTNDNGAGNGNANDNGAGNTNDNGGGGDCPDGSTQLETGLSDGGDAEYRLFPQGCGRFRVRVRNAPAFTTLPVTINGVVVGALTTDDRGRGELRYDNGFPPNFPAVHAGDVVGVGAGISGVFFSDCSSNSNCNG